MKGKCLKIIVVIYVVFVLVVVLYVVILKYNEFLVGVICEENWFDGYSFDKVYIVMFFVL